MTTFGCASTVSVTKWPYTFSDKFVLTPDTWTMLLFFNQKQSAIQNGDVQAAAAWSECYKINVWLKKSIEWAFNNSPHDH